MAPAMRLVRRRARREGDAEQHRGDGDHGAARKAERSRRGAELAPQQGHRQSGPEVGGEPRHGGEHGELLERARESERQGDGRLHQDGHRRRPVARMQRAEGPRAEAVLGQGEEVARPGEHGVAVGAQDRDHPADRHQEPAPPAEEPLGRVGERGRRIHHAGQGAQGHPLHARVDQGDDDDLDHQGERHVAARVLELPGRRGRVLEPRVGEEEQEHRVAQAARSRLRGHRGRPGCSRRRRPPPR